MEGQIKFTVDASGIAGELQDKQLAITAALMERVTAVNIALQRKIAGEKLQGEILKSHTNKLANSVRVVETTLSGAQIAGGVEAGGGPAFYGKFHEYGGTFDRKAGSVRLRTDGKGELLRQMDVKGTMSKNLAVFAKKSHVRVKTVPFEKGTVTFPERSFMRSTLQEERPNIIEELKEAVREQSK